MLANHGLEKHLRATRDATLIEDIDLRGRNVGELLILDKESGGILKESNVKAIVLAFAIDDADQFIEILQMGAGARERIAHAIEGRSVADKNLQIAAGRLRGDRQRNFPEERNAAIGAEQNFNAKRFAGLGLALVAPGAVDCGPAIFGTAGDVESDFFDFGLFVGIGVDAGEGRLNGDGELVTVRNGKVGGAEHVAKLNRRMASDVDVTVELKSGALGVGSVGDDAVVGRYGDEQRGQLRILNDIKMKMALFCGSGDVHFDGKSWRGCADAADDGGDTVLCDGADGPAGIHNFGGLEGRSERGDDVAASHRQSDRTETEKGMATNEDFVANDGGDGASGIHGEIAGNQLHANHVAGFEFGVIGARGGVAANHGAHTIGMKLLAEEGERLGHDAGENERGFNGDEESAVAESYLLRRRAGLRNGGECGGRAVGVSRRIRHGLLDSEHILNRRDASNGVFRKSANFKRDSAGELAIKINWTAAHSRYDSGLRNVRAGEFDEDDILLWSHGIFKDAEDGDIHFFNLVASENCVGDAFHSCMNIVERKSDGILGSEKRDSKTESQ